MGKTENLVGIAVLGLAAAYVLPKIIGNKTDEASKVEKVEIKEEAAVEKVEERQEGKTERTEIRWGVIDNIFGGGTKTKSKPETVQYVSSFSPKVVQDAAVKMATPNPYTYTATGKPNYALTSSFNQILTSAKVEPTKNAPIKNAVEKIVSAVKTISNKPYSNPIIDAMKAKAKI